MKKLLLLALFLIAASASAADYYVVASGGSDTDGCGAIGTPCTVRRVICAQSCYAGPVIQPGDNIYFRAGTYTNPSVNALTITGYRGNHVNGVLYSRYQDEEAIVDCKQHIDNSPNCIGTLAGPPVNALVHLIHGSTAVTTVLTSPPQPVFVTTAGVGKGWQQQSIAFGTSKWGDTPHEWYLVSSVGSTTSLTLTGAWTGDTGDYDAILPGIARWVTFKGFKVLNSSDMTRVSEHVRVQLTNGSKNIDWVDGAQEYEVNPTGQVSVTTGSTRANYSSGTAFTCGLPVSTVTVTQGLTTIVRTAGSNFVTTGTPAQLWPGKEVFINDESYTVASVQDISNLTLTTPYLGTNGSGKSFRAPGTCSGWNNDDIIINGVTYQVQDIQTTTRLTLKTSFLGAPNTYSTILPATYSSQAIKVDELGTIIPAPGVDMIISYCPTSILCIARSPWTLANQSLIPAQLPLTAQKSTLEQNTSFIAGMGGRLINMYFYDHSGGTIVRGQNGTQTTLRGSIMIYSGDISSGRGMGHGFYLQNRVDTGEWGRSTVERNMVIRPHDLASQIYSEDGSGLNSYIKQKDNIMLLPGHKKWPTLDWLPLGNQVSGGAFYLGSVTASLSPGCPKAEGNFGPGSEKTATGDILDHNFLYAPPLAPFTLGGGKGSCNSQIINNTFYATGNPPLVSGGTYPPLVISNNVFTAAGIPVTGGMGGPAPLFNRTNFPACTSPGVPAGCNTYLDDIPSTGAPVVFYEPNIDEIGKGFAVVDNKSSASTVTVDLCLMGGYAGEVYKLFNAQSGADPWHSPTISAGTIASCPKNVTVTATIAAADILQPGFTVDGPGSELWHKPPDMGPRMVPLSLERDFGAAPPAPTITPTNTSTNTFTATVTRTFTPSLTPTNTPSRTPTFTPSITPSASVTPSRTPSQSATPTPSNTNTPTNTGTFTPSRTPTRTATPTGGGSGNTSIDPATCIINPPMTLTTGVIDYPGHYVSSAVANNGIITCQFNVSVDGVYYGYAKIYGLDGTHDSFNISVDGDGAPPCELDGDVSCGQIFDVASTKDPNDSCHITRLWDQVRYQDLNQRNIQGGSCTGEGARWSKFLSASQNPHRIVLRQRDADTRLYYLYFSTNANYDPFDPQPTPTPGPAGFGCPASCYIPAFYRRHTWLCTHIHNCPKP